MENEQSHFLKHWFEGFSNGLEQLDPTSREILLEACGLACAQSCTLQVYQDAWQASRGNLAEFLAQLADKFPEGIYERLDDQTISVLYQHCACDLVQNGWVSTPLMCRCSLHNLKQNFQHAIGQPVDVKLNTSILASDERCSFEVHLPAMKPHPWGGLSRIIHKYL